MLKSRPSTRNHFRTADRPIERPVSRPAYRPTSLLDQMFYLDIDSILMLDSHYQSGSNTDQQPGRKPPYRLLNLTDSDELDRIVAMSG